MATPPLRTFGRVFARGFHATAPAPAKHSKAKLEHMLRNLPPYPYPVPHTFKQAWFGLYGGAHVQFGNNVPEQEKTKTRRVWLPNVRHKKLWSAALKQWVEIDVTANVLRTIDKVGGLDAYVTGTKPARLKELGPAGWKLRWRVLQTEWWADEMKKEWRQLGLGGYVPRENRVDLRPLQSPRPRQFVPTATGPDPRATRETRARRREMEQAREQARAIVERERREVREQRAEAAGAAPVPAETGAGERVAV